MVATATEDEAPPPAPPLAFDALYAKYARDLMARSGLPREDAEDAAHTVFLAVWRRWDRYSRLGEAHQRHTLYLAIRQRAIDHRRKQSARDGGPRYVSLGEREYAHITAS